MSNTYEIEAVQSRAAGQNLLNSQEMGEFLARIPLFRDLPKTEISHLGDAFQWRDAPAGTILFREGELGNCMTILIEGQIEVIQALGTPDEHILAVVGEPGEVLGEMSMFYRDGIRSASGRSRNDSRLLELKRADFDELLHRRPELAIGILKQLSLRLRNSENTTIRDMQEKNRQLTKAYLELKAAQAQIIEVEKLEHELRTARRIQESILPKEMPKVPGWKVSAYWEPAREVGGDFYDFVQYGDGRLVCLVGDVTDKGVPAALVMATTRSVLRVAAKKMLAPGEVLGHVNDLLFPDMPSKMFVTCLCLVLDPASGYLRFANAGHELPYQLTARGPVERRATGFPLGLLPGMKYDETEGRLEPGDSLLLYSDGLVEAHNKQREMVSFPRLHEWLSEYIAAKQNSSAAVEPLIEYLMSKLADFTGPGWQQEDDVTLVVVERETLPQVTGV